jgi:hypothetical protein
MPVGVSAYVALANVTLGSSAATVTFSSISQAYRDLVLIQSGTATGLVAMQMRFNGDNTETNYFRVDMQGNGSTALSAANNNSGFGVVFTGQGQNTVSIMDYSATDKHKSMLWRSDGAANLTLATAGRWANTAAITSFQVLCNTALFSAGTTFALYGIAS